MGCRIVARRGRGEVATAILPLHAKIVLRVVEQIVRNLYARVKVVREAPKEKKKRTYIRSDLELLVHAGSVRRCSKIFAEQILVEHGFNLIVGVSVLIAIDALALAAELAEDLEGGTL